MEKKIYMCSNVPRFWPVLFKVKGRLFCLFVCLFVCFFNRHLSHLSLLLLFVLHQVMSNQWRCESDIREARQFDTEVTMGADVDNWSVGMCGSFYRRAEINVEFIDRGCVTRAY